MAGEDCVRKRPSGSTTTYKSPENEEMQRRPDGDRSFQNSSNGEVLSLGINWVCISLYCGQLGSNVAYIWLGSWMTVWQFKWFCLWTLRQCPQRPWSCCAAFPEEVNDRTAALILSLWEAG